MNAGRVSEEIVESQEVLMERWLEISADGAITEVERATYTAAMTEQHRRLLAFDVAVKWVVRTVRRGFSAENDRKRLSDERNVRAVLTDPYGAMAAD